MYKLVKEHKGETSIVAENVAGVPNVPCFQRPMPSLRVGLREGSGKVDFLGKNLQELQASVCEVTASRGLLHITGMTEIYMYKSIA